MEKEEQIKRLAQNLFNSGFTKSMDHAIHTAANMLGFSDALVNSKKSDLGNQPEEVVTERMSGYSRDMAKRITQSIAQERVFSQVPSSLRPAIQTGFERNENAYQQSQNVENIEHQNVTHQTSSMNNNMEDHFEVKREEQKDHFSNTIFVDNGDDEFQRSDDSRNVENIFEGNTQSFEQREPQRFVEDEHNSIGFSSEPNLFDDYKPPAEVTSDENFIEEKRDVSDMAMPDWAEEEQTSLMSGYMDSSEDKFENSYDNLSEHQSMEKTFKGDSPRFSDMEENPSVCEINSRFESVLGPEEDFFTASLEFATKSEGSISQKEEFNSVSEVSNVQTTHATTSGSTASAMPEATVNLAEMFDFRNLKN